jgi:menaquinone-9 beta-reductase
MDTDLKTSIDQRPIAEVPDRLWDVIIVGSGPAGAIAAVHLATNGHCVLFVDQERFPRDKVCGDALISDAISSLDKVGLREKICDAGYRSETATVFSPTGVKFDIPGEYITIRRSILDTMIARRGLDVGATFCQGKVIQVAIESDGLASLSFHKIPKKIKARFCIIATGAQVALAKRMGIVDTIQPNALALRCYVRSSFKINSLVGSYERELIPGYGWIFPIGNDEYNVGVVCHLNGHGNHNKNLHEAFRLFISRFPMAKSLFQNGQIVSPLRGAPLRCGLKGVQLAASGNILCIGETIGTTLPCTWEGIGKAMKSAEIATCVIHKAIVDGQPLLAGKHYTSMLKEQMQPKYKGYEIALKWLKSSPGIIGRLMVHRVQKSKFLMRMAVGVISETEDPQGIFSFRGIWRLLRG